MTCPPEFTKTQMEEWAPLATSLPAWAPRLLPPALMCAPGGCQEPLVSTWHLPKLLLLSLPVSHLFTGTSKLVICCQENAPLPPRCEWGWGGGGDPILGEGKVISQGWLSVHLRHYLDGKG